MEDRAGDVNGQDVHQRPGAALPQQPLDRRQIIRHEQGTAKREHFGGAPSALEGLLPPQDPGQGEQSGSVQPGQRGQHRLDRAAGLGNGHAQEIQVAVQVGLLLLAAFGAARLGQPGRQRLRGPVQLVG